MYAWMLMTALALSEPESPASQPPPPAVVIVESPSQLLAMPPELRERLNKEVLAQRLPPPQRLERLVHFMLDADGLGVTYEEGATYSVAQTYAVRKANCLSFTLLFTAMARAAGLDAYPQEIDDTLSWRQNEGTLFRNNHINTGVRLGGRTLTVDVSGEQVIARSNPVVATDLRLLAHYYNNLSIAQLEQGQIAPALELMDGALRADPNYAPLWSNSGVLHLRNGDVAGAEASYLKALAIDPEDDGALFNMVNLVHRLGDDRREAEYRKRLDRVQKKDPLHHFMQALDFERNGDYPQAIEHYLRAIRLHHGEHRFYSALARVYVKAGDTRRAAKALARAQALSDGAIREAYRSQLRDLRVSN
jgi:Flp pilus assembly protein TadD